jgi:hypothetical protein
VDENVAEKQRSKEYYPCGNVDCISHRVLIIKDREILHMFNNSFPCFLIPCLFCDKFNRQDMFQRK